jgi:hypothetical protein
MGQPFTLFHQLRLESKSHEVATRDETGILLTEEEWCLADGAMVRLVGSLVLGHACCE